MIHNAKERAALAISKLQQAGDDFERAEAIFVEGAETAYRMAELVLEFSGLMDKVHENNLGIVQRIEPTLELDNTAIEDLTSVGISYKYPAANSVMEPIKVAGRSNLGTRAALLEFAETDEAIGEYRGDTLVSAVWVGFDATTLQQSMQTIAAAATLARLSAEALGGTL